MKSRYDVSNGQKLYLAGLCIFNDIDFFRFFRGEDSGEIVNEKLLAVYGLQLSVGVF